MTQYKLENIEPDDLDNLLVKLEKSFGLSFAHTEFMHIKTFGELCDHISNKIELNHNSDCTSQQAFYKLREAINSVIQRDTTTIISTQTSLTELLPKQGRRSVVKKLEKHLGFKLNILRPPDWISTIFVIITLTSLVAIFFYWKISLIALAFSIAGNWIAKKLGIDLEVQTLGELSEKMTRENYVKSRRNPKTVNKEEIEKVMIDYCSEELLLDRSVLTREAKF